MREVSPPPSCHGPMSHVMYHISHMSRATCNLILFSFLFFPPSWVSSLWRVCYQGLYQRPIPNSQIKRKKGVLLQTYIFSNICRIQPLHHIPICPLQAVTYVIAQFPFKLAANSVNKNPGRNRECKLNNKH